MVAFPLPYFCLRKRATRFTRLLHFFVVGYVNLGRKLGLGTRAAAKALSSQAQSAASAAREKAPVIAAQTREHASSVAQQHHAMKRSISAGTRGFGRGFWKPLTRAFRALWHEVTGLFFAIFTLFFAQGLWRVRDAWKGGPEHRHFEVYLVVTVLFGYFSVSSFVRSRRSPH